VIQQECLLEEIETKRVVCSAIKNPHLDLRIVEADLQLDQVRTKSFLLDLTRDYLIDLTLLAKNEGPVDFNYQAEILCEVDIWFC
jgi:hypothetical protein